MKTITKYQVRLIEADGVTARTKTLGSEPSGSAWLEHRVLPDGEFEEQVYDCQWIEETVTAVYQRRKSRITGCNLCEARRLDAKKRAEKGEFVPEVECMCCGYWRKSIEGEWLENCKRIREEEIGK